MILETLTLFLLVVKLYFNVCFFQADQLTEEQIAGK